MDRTPDLAIMLFDLSITGVVRNAVRIAAKAHEAGLATEIWVVQDRGPARVDVPDGVPIVSFGKDIGDLYSRRQRKAASLASMGALIELLRQRQPKLALSAGNHFHVLASAAFRDAEPGLQTRLIGRVSSALPRFSWITLPHSLRKRRRARKQLMAMDRLIAVSEEIRNGLTGRLWIPDDRITVIRNGIDTARAETLAKEPLSHEWFADGGPPVLLGVGRVVPQKGFDVLLKAFASARKKKPLRLVILGTGPAEHLVSLEALAESLGVTADVDFHGAVSNPYPYYKAASLFVLSSRWEGMSNALLEAMACGCPVVSTVTPGSSELLEYGRFGALVPADQPEVMAKAILAQLASAVRGKKLRQRAEEFDLGTTMDEYLALFAEELAKPPRQ
jgi:glycosyltransferase involved in cell wall biosynthesis